MSSKPVDYRLQILGQGAYKFQPSSIRGVLERETRGVKKGTLETRDDAQVARHPPSNTAVQRVAHGGMTDNAQVDADLMRAAGVNRDSRERQGAAERLG